MKMQLIAALEYDGKIYRRKKITKGNRISWFSAGASIAATDAAAAEIWLSQVVCVPVQFEYTSYG